MAPGVRLALGPFPEAGPFHLDHRAGSPRRQARDQTSRPWRSVLDDSTTPRARCQMCRVSPRQLPQTARIRTVPSGEEAKRRARARELHLNLRLRVRTAPDRRGRQRRGYRHDPQPRRASWRPTATGREGRTRTASAGRCSSKRRSGGDPEALAVWRGQGRGLGQGLVVLLQTALVARC